MPSEKDDILEFNQYIRLDKMPCIICTDIESWIKKTYECTNNPDNSPVTKIGEPIPCGYSMSATWGFDNIENKRTLYCGGDAKNVIDSEKKTMLRLTKERRKPHQEAKISYICRKYS